MVNYTLHTKLHDGISHFYRECHFKVGTILLNPMSNYANRPGSDVMLDVELAFHPQFSCTTE